MDTTLKVTTNNVPRELFSAAEVYPEELEAEGLDYIEGDDVYSPRLFRYRGTLYDVNEFTYLDRERVPVYRAVPGHWDGIQPDSYFSGVLVRYAHDHEAVIVGYYAC